uniref:Uncharacterized protein n=1 Tax=Oryzias sinensis TaxID=183150 RepID=A0A8C8DWM1_9TELE
MPSCLFLLEAECSKALSFNQMIVLLRNFETMTGMMGCYILDGFLILYGIVLTVLYFRLKTFASKAAVCVLQGLTSPSTDTYDTVRTNKKLMV